MKFSYVAIPYGATEEVRAERMLGFWAACSYLIGRGDNILSPMTLEPAVILDPSIPYDWNHWRAYSHKLLEMCSKLIVIQLPGWHISAGVAGEVLEAQRLGLEIEYLQWPLIK